MNNSFTIYNASAGSGKTFTLVKEYLSLLLKSNRKDAYKNILAITFTNKAVEEMKTRIVKSLESFTQKETKISNSPLMEVVCADTGMSEAQVKENSGLILKSIIHNYAAFEISTIDGFTHRILRTFAKDLGIPVNFEVELNTGQVLMEAVESLINKAGTDEKLTKTLINYSLTKADEDKSWDITRDLFEIAQLLTNENNQAALQQLKGKNLEDFDKFRKTLKKEIQKTETDISGATGAFFELLNSNNLEFGDFSGGYVPKHFLKLKEGNRIDGFDKAWMEKLSSASLYKKSFKDEAKKSILDSIQPEIVHLFEVTKQAYFQLEFLQEVKKKIVQLSLLNAINQEIELIKKERSLVLISEFNPKISEQVKDQPAPFIYERLGERYQNYFIDEFQDTSQMQWENLIPLIDHSLSGEQEDGKGSSLMLVGDAKQSIYRWRGGKAEQFIELSQDSNPFSIDKKVENLPRNFRSGGNVVDFNNRFFGFASASLNFPDYRKLFEESRQEASKDDFGYVNISFIEAENKEEEMEIYPEKVLEIIKDLEKQKTPKKDICILTRKKNEGIAIASYLSENNIPVVSSETLLISNSAEVGFIKALLQFSLNPENDELKLDIFEYLEDRLEIENPFRLISKNLEYNGPDFFNWLESYAIRFDLEEIKRVSLYEAAEYIIRSFSLVKDSDAYIQFFLDYIYEMTQKSAGGIQNFLDSWEQDKDRLSIVVPKEENAVQIMTIHKSKGLEFPVVIYPFANADLQDTSKDSLWIDMPGPINEIPVAYISASKKMLNWGGDPESLYKDLLYQKEMDTLNVLYVACTRASQQLYLLSKLEINKKTGEEKSNRTSGLLIGFLKNQGLWDGGTNYEFGSKDYILSEEKEGLDTVRQKKFISSATQNTAVNIVTRSGSLWDTRQEQAIEKGQIAHDILAEIDNIEDIEKEVEKAVSSGMISREAAPRIKSLVLEVTSHPDLKKFYQPGVDNYNERDILLKTGTRLRPDRLNFEGNKVSILDYKTGEPAQSHELQLLEYGEALTEMGFEIENKILIYLNSPIKLRNV
ncbi:UvrD-helicase domain-containing protein [Salegentibacter chungangensis]|uniref:DNA 3'-5' helicase n=1 Tax=Salegentibacter chungangensis TaxID=1335724 RepID=A0ABW3NP67_9FLAO